MTKGEETMSSPGLTLGDIFAVFINKSDVYEHAYASRAVYQLGIILNSSGLRIKLMLLAAQNSVPPYEVFTLAPGEQLKHRADILCR